VAPQQVVSISCEAPDDEVLFVDWLNALIFEIATRSMLFSRFRVGIETARCVPRPGASRSIRPATRLRSRPRAQPSPRWKWRRGRMAPGSRNASSTSEPTRIFGTTIMDLSRLDRVSDFEWRLAPSGRMRVPGVIYADEALVRDMDEKVLEQVSNVAMLPGIVKASYAMPDAHWGYGFPIGGVAAFDPDQGGIVSAGGVGFDISCGVRTMLSGMRRADIEPVKERLADELSRAIPAGVGRRGKIHLSDRELDAHACRRRTLGARAGLWRGR
jgi:hypothetical protein